MKVTRVLLAANDNPDYSQFWNPLSRIYKENFGIQPTLVWLGEAPDIERLGLSSEFGNILIRKPHPEHHIGWQSAWSIFWHMKFYPDDTFLTMGIDQVPLSKLYFEILKAFDDDSYVMLADDGYPTSNWATGGTSPTSFHVCKGSVASKIYGFDELFHVEIDKISNSGIKPYYEAMGNKWGLDESYASHKLREYRDLGGKVECRSMFKYICDMRIECGRINETSYSRDRLKAGAYGDAHLCRPFVAHKEYIETMLKLIPSNFTPA